MYINKNLKIKTVQTVLFGVAISLVTLPAFAQTKTIPHLEKRGLATQLIVDGKPYLVLGGELHNATTSSLEFLKPMLTKLKVMNLNTTLAVVSWDLIEPQEGKFDFSLVDGMLRQARENNLRIAICWFGSWKNGLSHYVPGWVKNDYKRFPRVRLDSDRPIETVTPLSEEGMKSDSRAFAALMKHLREVDSKERTVIMVQVENEVGVIGASRDRSTLADTEFNKPVPAELITRLQSFSNELQPAFQKNWQDSGSRTSGTWSQIFGQGNEAEEAFMAYYYAKYINNVAAAGKAEYNLPMFVNAWIVQPEDRMPGDYPSGGPQAHVHDIWRAMAPKIDIFAPDIYLKDFQGITAQYKHSWNPLFIPESFADTLGAANAYYAIGFHKGIGYSPFGIDGKRAPANPLNAILPKAYKMLDGMSQQILEAQSKGTITAVIIDRQHPSEIINMGGYNMEISLRRARNTASTLNTGYAIIINTGPDEFLLSGLNLQFMFSPAGTSENAPKIAGIESLYEGEFENGNWKPGRKLNGDNIMLSYKLAQEAAVNQTGSVARFEGNDPVTLKVKLYKFD